MWLVVWGFSFSPQLRRDPRWLYGGVLLTVATAVSLWWARRGLACGFSPRRLSSPPSR
ncbi:MAG: hypothetical protein ACO2PN_08430 [Pyrobaculum sp.]